MHKSLIFSLFIAIMLLFLTSSCADRAEQSKELVRAGKKQMAMGKIREAIQYYDDAIEKDGQNSEAWHLRGNCKVNLGNHASGIEDYNQSITLNPGYAAAYYSRGLAWFYTGEDMKACEDWKKAEELGYPNIGDRTRHCQ